jgi:aminoglycoside/choline kinase family phosphotransferase
MPDLKRRLTTFLEKRGFSNEIEELHPDASTRGYFRVWRDGGSAVACVYPQPSDPAVGIYIDVTELFLAGGLPVADIIDCDPVQAVVIEEDLGDRILRDEILTADATRKNDLLDKAIGLIARIQGTTQLAYERGSIASRLKFDTEKLSWELDYFKTHYFTTLRGKPLSREKDDSLSGEFAELSAELETYATVLCHRDFHSANLMVDTHGRLRIIDHQDARIGSAAYDLVSLLLDRITELPDEEWLDSKRRLFMTELAESGMREISKTAFLYEFRLQTIQRCIKAAGTFSYQSAVRGKTHFVPFIEPMFKVALSAANEIERFPILRNVLEGEIQSPAFSQ